MIDALLLLPSLSCLSVVFLSLWVFLVAKTNKELGQILEICLGQMVRPSKSLWSRKNLNLVRTVDASKFGQSYLSKFGWDSSQGLGAGGDGRTSHIKVQQKLDMMGIGAQHQKDPNGIAWKQNKDFENVLRRLNASMGNGDGEMAEEEVTALGGAFISATPAEADKGSKKEKKDKKDKKRKRDADDAAGEEEDSKKAKAEEPASAPAAPKGKVVPRHRAYVSV